MKFANIVAMLCIAVALGACGTFPRPPGSVIVMGKGDYYQKDASPAGLFTSAPLTALEKDMVLAGEMVTPHRKKLWCARNEIAPENCD